MEALAARASLRVRLARRTARELLAWSEAAAPREACGLLLGHLAPEAVVIETATLARNLAHQAGRFDVDPRDQLAAERCAASRGLQVLGAWHSHAARSAVPSASDRAGSGAYPLAIIVGRVRTEPQLRAWTTRDGWQALEVIVEAEDGAASSTGDGTARAARRLP